MNSVKEGDKFEEYSFDIINKALDKGQIGYQKALCKVFKKRKYYSPIRENHIIFDIAIEVWPKGANTYSHLCIIECKSSKKNNVPVDDIEEFHNKVTQVSGLNVKAILITNTTLQLGAKKSAKNYGIMVIEVDQSQNNYDIVLYRNSRKKSSNDVFEILGEKLISAIKSPKIEGLKKLSKDQIESIALNYRSVLNLKSTYFDRNRFINSIIDLYKLDVVLDENLENKNGKSIDGKICLKSNTIYIDKNFQKENNFTFALCHEFGHFVLHKNLNINQVDYGSFVSSKYDFFENMHVFRNDFHWLEWQANRFAVSFLMPKNEFVERMVMIRYNAGIRKPTHIYLDNQSQNQADYRMTLIKLSSYFGTSLTSVRNRLDELNLITDNSSETSYLNSLRNITFNK